MYQRISHSVWAYFGILMICCTGARGQTIICSGKVSDASGSPLPHANVLAQPHIEKGPVFAIADEQGSYRIQLLANTTYTIRVAYLGYAPKNLTITTGEKNITRDLLLLPDTAMLDEVVVNADIPVLVKEDTLIYQTDAFSSGKERKLGELLRKLPGVEVDKAGKITVGGKEVKKVMVEDQPFFTGKSRLATDHIPADAVAQVEMLDNYNELPLLKGLRDSDEMAMNIRLKADKKNFTFGDIGLGGGPEDRYSLQPDLFYYSPQTTVNMIGDINNEGRNAFTLADYMAFEGDYANLLKTQSGLNEQFGDDLDEFLGDKDFKENDQQFGALNVRHKLSPKSELNTYVLLSGENKSTQMETWNEYSTGLDVLNETRFQNSEQHNFFLMGKIRLDHSPSENEQLTANSYIKLARNTLGENISAKGSFLQQIMHRNQLEGLQFKQHVRYSKKLHSKHTLLAEASFGHRKNSPESHWAAGHPLLEYPFSLTGRSISTIVQDQELSSNTAGFLLKDYWQVNPLNHLYFSAGFTFSGELFRSQTNSGSHHLPLAVNRLRYQKQDAFAGLEYKIKLGKFTFKPALFYHYYNWDAAQPVKKHHRHKSWLQPEFTVAAKLGRTAQMRFRYNMNMQLPSVRQLAARPIVQAFNQVSQGAPELEHAHYHSFSVNYSSIRLPGTFFSAGLNWQRKIRNIKQSMHLYLPSGASAAKQGYLDQFSSFIMLNRPESSLIARFAWSKKINRIRYTLNGNYMHNDFFQVINEQTLKNRSRSILGTAKAGTSLKHFPDLSIGYTVHLNRYRTADSRNDFTSHELFGQFSFVFMEDFQFQMDYSRLYYKTQAELSEQFETADASLHYQTPKSPWGLELRVSNLLNTRQRRKNSFSELYISDQRSFILPRILLFTVSYKL